MAEIPASAAIMALFLLSAAPALAEVQDLSQAASDPTAALMSFQLQGYYSPSVHGTDEDAAYVQFRAAIPFEAFGLQNIARLTLPYVTESPSGTTGLTDSTVFDLVTFTRPWGRFGLGAVALLPTGSADLSAGQFALGPAAGFTVQNGRILWGAFNQNVFTVAGDDDKPEVNSSTLQPILNIGLGNGWSTGLSDMSFAYDWDEGDWTSLPLGLKVASLQRVGSVPVQFTFSYEVNFADHPGTPEETWGAVVKVLLPRG